MKYLWGGWVILLSACAEVPCGDTGSLVSVADDRSAVAIFVKQQPNEQYCVYETELSRNPLHTADEVVFQTSTLLTPSSVSAENISEALLLESVHTSRAYNAAASAFYPLLVCGGSLVSLPFLRKRVIPAGVALLSCSAMALLVHKTSSATSEGEEIASGNVAKLLAGSIHYDDRAVKQLQQVLPWLETENALPCPSMHNTQREESK